MRIAIEDLKLDQLTLIYPGEAEIMLEEKITIQGLTPFTTRET